VEIHAGGGSHRSGIGYPGVTARSPAAIERRLAALESAERVRGLMARYMTLCDSLGPDTPMDELAALFSEDAIWIGVGARYAQTYGEYRGRAAIVDMLGKYRGPPAHFAFNAHYLCSEAIESGHDTARGRWMMLQCSTYFDGRSDLRSARLVIDFQERAGRWQIERFQTENLFSRPIGRWDDPARIPTPTTEQGKS